MNERPNKMLKSYFFIAFVPLLIFACRRQNVFETSVLQRLSHYYKDTSFTELYIFPDTAYNEVNYLLRGNQIDSATMNYLSKRLTKGLPWTEGFYGVYSFKIDEQFIGLLTRVPSEYSSTSVDLWMFDLKKDSIFNNFQLADIFGDAGASTIKTSYLFYDNQGYLKSLSYEHDTYDHSVEDVSDTTVESYRSYYLIKFEKYRIDTLSLDSLVLNVQFKKQFEKLSSY